MKLTNDDLRVWAADISDDHSDNGLRLKILIAEVLDHRGWRAYAEPELKAARAMRDGLSQYLANTKVTISDVVVFLSQYDKARSGE